MDSFTLVVGLLALVVGILVGFYSRGIMERNRAPRPVSHMNTALESRTAGEGRASLVVVEGQGLGDRYPLTSRGLKVGRSPDNDLVLDDPAVSRVHVDIRCENDGFYTCDLESTNGTFVNGERVSRRALKDGDVIQIGATVLRFCSNP